MYEATLCAEEQGAFWEYYHLAYDQQRRINFDQAFAVDLAASPQLQLNLESFETCLETGRYTDKAQQEVAVVRKVGVTHTPAFAIGGLLYSGRLRFDELRQLIDNELAPGLLESISTVGY